VFQIISSHREPLPEDCLIRNWNAGQRQQRRLVGGIDGHLRSLWKHVTAIELHREAVIVISWVVHGRLLVQRQCNLELLSKGDETLARRSQGPINILVCICIDQNESAYCGDISNRVPLSRFDNAPTVLVPESRTCQAGHRPTGCETPIVRSFQPNPIHGTVTVD
jgi:hypothetical protein